MKMPRTEKMGTGDNPLAVVAYETDGEEANSDENSSEAAEEEQSLISQNDNAVAVPNDSTYTLKQCSTTSFGGHTVNYIFQVADSVNPETVAHLFKRVTSFTPNSSKSSLESGFGDMNSAGLSSSMSTPSNMNAPPWFYQQSVPQASRNRARSDCLPSNETSSPMPKAEDVRFFPGRRHSNEGPQVTTSPINEFYASYPQYGNTRNHYSSMSSDDGPSREDEMQQAQSSSHQECRIQNSSNVARIKASNVYYEEETMNSNELLHHAPPSDAGAMLQRKRIISDRKMWEPLPNNFVKLRDFEMGIIPGTFYKQRATYPGDECYIVEMNVGATYCINLHNGRELGCYADVTVDDKVVAKLEMKGNERVTLRGSLYEKGKFIFLRAKDAPEEAGIDPGNEANGLVMVKFTPQKYPDESSSATSAVTVDEEQARKGFINVLNKQVLNFLGDKAKDIPLSRDEGADGTVRRSVDSSAFCSGATALIDDDEEQYAEDAADMAVDESQAVVIEVRLVARKTDEPYVPPPNLRIRPLASTKRPPLFDL